MNHHHSYSILVTGIARFYLTKLIKEHPHPLALVETLDENAMVEGINSFYTFYISRKSIMVEPHAVIYNNDIILLQNFTRVRQN